MRARGVIADLAVHDAVENDSFQPCDSPETNRLTLRPSQRTEVGKLPASV